MRYLLIFLMPLTACAAAKKPNTSIPKIDLYLYQGMPNAETPLMSGIARAQAHEFLTCSDQKFSQFVCMTHEDLNKIIDAYILGCKEWK